MRASRSYELLAQVSESQELGNFLSGVIGEATPLPGIELEVTGIEVTDFSPKASQGQQQRKLRRPTLEPPIKSVYWQSTESTEYVNKFTTTASKGTEYDEITYTHGKIRIEPVTIVERNHDEFNNMFRYGATLLVSKLSFWTNRDLLRSKYHNREQYPILPLLTRIKMLTVSFDIPD